MSGRPESRSPDRAADVPAGGSFTALHLLAVLTVLLGAGLIVSALSGGGGLGSYGVLIGALFVAAGVLRLRLLIARARR